jgi:hypothetical protein
MKLDEVIFTSYCFGDAYLNQQVRLRESILSVYPEANLHFVNEPEETGKPKFQQSLYGFKVNLVKECLQKGFKKIVFFDAAICLNGPIDYWFDIIKYCGVLAPVDRQVLSNVSSDACLKYLNINRGDLLDKNLAGGSVYVFDFDTEKCQKIFYEWARMEGAGMFGTQDDLSHDRLQSHRMDETCMALAMLLNGVKPLSHDEIKYAYEHPETKQMHGGLLNTPIVIKRHFK